MNNPFLKFRGQVLQAIQENNESGIDGCTGCIFQHEYAEYEEGICTLSAHIADNYGMECSDKGIIFIQHKFFKALKEL